MSDTTFYLPSPFFTTSRESIPRELRCALVEIQSKTAPVTSKSAKVTLHSICVPASLLLPEKASRGSSDVHSSKSKKIERMSDTTFYWRSRFAITSRNASRGSCDVHSSKVNAKLCQKSTKSFEGPNLLSSRAREDRECTIPN
ncbi:hypothetical protein V1478_014804 [Vespula squamosa]|uniref:Uncharacterized protein n=1 Tax=Vespula squamosa TaxID=30214 RepID=A0ABD2A3C1_VESSQ